MAKKDVDKQGGGILSSLKRAASGLVFEDTTPPDEQAVQVQVERPTFSSAPPPRSASPIAPPSEFLRSIADPAIVAKIMQRVKENTHEAYSRLQELMEGLSDVIPNENQRFRAAIVSMRKMGFDENTIRVIYDQRAEFIRNFAKDFEDAAKKKLEAATQQSDVEIDSIANEARSVEAEISSLTGRLSDLSRRKTALVTERQQRIDSLRQQETATRDAIAEATRQVNTERDSVSQFLTT